VLRWVLGSPRATSEGVSSRRARRETRRIKKVRGSKGHRSSPRNSNGGGGGLGVTRGEGRPGFHRKVCLGEGSMRVIARWAAAWGKDGASGEPMAFGGRRGEPMAEGDAAARRMRVRRVAPAWAQKYHAQEPLGTVDGPGVTGLPRCACTAW
jgi:hypothetical protein